MPPNDVEDQANERTSLLAHSDDDNASINSSKSYVRRIKALVLSTAGIVMLVLLGVAILVAIILAVTLGRHHNRGNSDRGTSPAPNPFKLPPPQPGLRNPSYLVRGRHGAVATEAEICSTIGIDVLKENGTATDAAIASALCVGTINMFSSGIGGGGFLIIRPPNDPLDEQRKKKHSPHHKIPIPHPETHPISIDFRETSPSGSHPNMYVKLDATASKIGGLSVGVPGELRGFQEAYKRYGGGVSWERIFEPSIKLAEKGWHVTAELDRRLRLFGGFMPNFPEWKAIFAPKGQLLKLGDKISRPAYGRTLRYLSQHGADAFYTGRLAESSIKTIRKAGGIMTLEDFANYKANVQPAVKGTYHGKSIYTTHLPSGGPVLLHLLNILENYNLKEQGRTPKNIHRFVEALKFAFARRTSLGDPAFAPQQGERLHQLLDKHFAKEVTKNLTDDRTHSIEYYDPEFAHHDDHGTTHLSIVDSSGSAVALTTTVNLIFGSRVMDPETGIIFNDEQDDFATPGLPDAFGLYPSPYNFPDHNRTHNFGKRPLSSTSAAIIDDEEGNFHLAIGGSGGSRIFGAVAQVLLNLEWGYDLSHAIEEPRVHDQLLPAYVSVESGLRQDLVAGLKSRGHNITLFDINLGIAEVQAVQQTSDGWFYGASDSRKNGVAKAY